MLTVSSSPYRMPRRCRICCRGLPEWDTHFQCSQHRECSKMLPCADCSLWPAPTWALSEAWLKAHPPFQRAPALVPSVVPSVTPVTPAPPEEASPAYTGTAIDLHASGDCDSESGEETSRAWRPPGAQSGSLSVSIPRYYGPAHTSGLPQTPGSEEPLSFLPQPQTTICHTPAVGGLTPLMTGGVSGISTSLTPTVGGITSLRIGGVPGASTSLTSAVGGITSLRIGGVPGTSTSLTSAVGGITPLMIGGVAGRTRDPQVPGVSQAGPLRGLQHCPPLLSHSAVPARLEEHQFVAQLAAGDRKGTKRAASGPSPASPPVGKKKKKGGKKASKPKKTKAANPHKKGRSGAVSDSDLFAMMQLVAGRHGWSVGDPPTPTSQGLAQTALHPATSAPPPVPPAGQAASYHTTMAPPLAPPAGQAASYHMTMAPPPAPPAGRAALYPMNTAPPPVFPAGQQPALFPPHRAPAALGAPPGEESFPPQAHTVPAESSTQSEGSIFTETSESDWPTLHGPTTVDTDVLSVTSGAPSLVEQEATLGLKHLSEEAEALLLRYLKEFYAVQPDAADQQPRASLLFRSGAEPDPGIPLTTDFKREYERIARGAHKGALPTLKRAFMFQPGDMDKFMTPEKLSPEVLALGEHVARGNPLRRKQFSEEDKRWTNIASLTRSSMRLAAYAGALTNLAVQADDLHVSEEDRMLLNSLLLSISELTFKYATRASLYTTHRRRDLALTALGFAERQRAQLTRDMPCEGPYLFSGQFTSRLKEELAVRQQARELAGQLRQSQPPRYHSPGQPRALPRAQAAPPRVTVTLPSPPPNRGARGGRGRSYRGRRRGQHGQRGHRQAAQGRGGF